MIVKSMIVPLKLIQQVNLEGWKRVIITLNDEEDLKALENESVRKKVEEN